jgi:multidrug resistance efflux pump
MRSNEKVPWEIAAAAAEEDRADARIASARAREDAAGDELSRRTEELSASYATALERAQELLYAGRDPGPANAEVARARRNQLHAFLTGLEAKMELWQAEIDRLKAWVRLAEAEVKDAE